MASTRSQKRRDKYMNTIGIILYTWVFLYAFLSFCQGIAFFFSTFLIDSYQKYTHKSRHDMFFHAFSMSFQNLFVSHGACLLYHLHVALASQGDLYKV